MQIKSTYNIIKQHTHKIKPNQNNIKPTQHQIESKSKTKSNIIKIK